MTKSLKHILFNIACLPSGDQRWILRHLSDVELKTLNHWQGLKLLQDAQRFRSLKASPSSPERHSRHPERSEGSPSCGDLNSFRNDMDLLATKAPLYVAIVIEQGGYEWTDLFLERFDMEGSIRNSLKHQVLDVKPRVKQAIFGEWERLNSFDNLLDDSHV